MQIIPLYKLWKDFVLSSLEPFVLDSILFKGNVFYRGDSIPHMKQKSFHRTPKEWRRVKESNPHHTE